MLEVELLPGSAPGWPLTQVSMPMPRSGQEAHALMSYGVCLGRREGERHHSVHLLSCPASPARSLPWECGGGHRALGSHASAMARSNDARLQSACGLEASRCDRRPFHLWRSGADGHPDRRAIQMVIIGSCQPACCVWANLPRPSSHERRGSHFESTFSTGPAPWVPGRAQAAPALRMAEEVSMCAGIKLAL